MVAYLEKVQSLEKTRFTGISVENGLESAIAAPYPFASSNLLSLDVNAVTSQPYRAANCPARCPSPPVPIRVESIVVRSLPLACVER
jgi:hypothetical protein